MIVRKAKVTEAKKIKEIIDFHAEKGLMLSRGLDEIYSGIRDFMVCIVDNQAVGVCALVFFTEDFAEIRSLAVLDEFRHKNIGAFLLKSCIAEAKEFNIKNIFTLTYVSEYFKKLSFESISKDMLPHKIWRDCVSCEHFYHCDEEALIYRLEE